MTHCYCTLVRLDTGTRHRPQRGARWLVQCAQSQECSPWLCLFQWLCRTSVISTTWIKRREVLTTLIQFPSHLRNESQNRRRTALSRDFSPQFWNCSGELFPPILKLKRRFIPAISETEAAIKSRHETESVSTLRKNLSRD